MRIEDFKRWHWCIVGLIIGAAFAFIRLSSLPREDRGLERVAPNVFEADLLRAFEDPKHSQPDPISRRKVFEIGNIQIHPPVDMPLPGERDVYAEYLSYEVVLVRPGIVKPGNPMMADTMPRQVIMALYSPKQKSIAGDIKDLSIREFLDKLNAAIPKLDAKLYPQAKPFTYKVAWIETPKAAYSVYSTGGLIVIGLLWPTLLNFLIVAGYGRPRTEADAQADRKPSKTVAAKAKPGVTQDQLDQLDQLEAELEAKLREGASATPAAAPQTAPVAAPVPVLSAGPMEAPRETPEQTRQRKGYGADQGDYYPTEVHGKKN
jgi:hypothetical protein